MKVTLDLPDDLMREVKLRAIDQNRSIKDVVVDALRRGLDATAEGDTAVRRVRLPLVECAPESTERDELSPKAVADLLIAQERRSGTPGDESCATPMSGEA